MSKTPYRIVFVCLGNICRSPAAEGIFRALDKDKCFHIESRATSAYHEGSKPSGEMLEIAQEQGLELTSLSSPFKEEDFENFDMIFAADESVKKTLEKRGAPKAKLKLYTSYSPQVLSPDIPDPYFKGKDAYRQVFHLLQEVINDLYQSLKKSL